MQIGQSVCSKQFSKVCFQIGLCDYVSPYLQRSQGWVWSISPVCCFIQKVCTPSFNMSKVGWSVQAMSYPLQDILVNLHEDSLLLLGLGWMVAIARLPLPHFCSFSLAVNLSRVTYSLSTFFLHSCQSCGIEERLPPEAEQISLSLSFLICKKRSLPPTQSLGCCQH